MRKRIFSVLLASSTFLALESPVLAKDCPPLNVAEITVQDPQKNIKLRTDPQKAGLNVPGAQGTNVTVQPGKPLLIIKDTPAEFNTEENLCYYPVEFKSGEKHGNVIPGILSHKPYWISAKGIKDYATLPKADAVTPTRTPSGGQSSQNPESSGKTDSGFPLLQILAWSIIPVLIGALLISAFLQRKKLFPQLGWDLDQEGSNHSRPRGRKGRETDKGGHSSNPIQETESPDSLTRLISATTNVQHKVDRNTGHIKGVEALLTTQNQLIQQNNQLLGKIVELLEGDRRSSQNFPPVTTENQKEGSIFRRNDVSIDPTMYSDPQPLPSKLPDVSHQINDPFYKDVIHEFNDSNDNWLLNHIKTGQFRKVKLTEDSVIQQYDPLNVDKLTLDENGGLLVYKANNKDWVIPNRTMNKWRVSILPKLFINVNNGATLVRPAEVAALGNNMWQVKEKGEFA